MTPEIENAREILRATRALRLDEQASTDLRDRLGLATVVVGLREVAAFGFAEKRNEDSLRALKGVLNAHDLPTQVTRQVRTLHRPLDIPQELAAVFDRVDTESYARETSKLLWVCRSPKTREQIKRAVDGEILSGRLLGYPRCCVEQDREHKEKLDEAFRRALVDATGQDPAALERGLRDNLVVPLALDFEPGGDVSATEERFPFVQHVACRGCLSSADSPTARLNEKYEQLARDIAPSFHAALGKIAKVTVQITQTVDAAERNGLTRETIDVQTNQELQRLFRETERMRDDFLREF